MDFLQGIPAQILTIEEVIPLPVVPYLVADQVP
jgi:hypothetical protein